MSGSRVHHECIMSALPYLPAGDAFETAVTRIVVAKRKSLSQILIIIGDSPY